MDCLGSHPNNSAWDFTVDLKHYLNLKGKWECALMEIDYVGPTTELYVFSAVCSDSYVELPPTSQSCKKNWFI